MRPRLILPTTGNIAYTSIPKCANTTIRQLLYRVGNVGYFEGEIYRAKDGILDWNKHREHRKEILNRLGTHAHFHFTVVRNPFSRLLSAFHDTIMGTQADGQPYGTADLRQSLKNYGIGPHTNDVEAFQRFVIFVRDSIQFRYPRAADQHWAPMAWHASSAMQLDLPFHCVLNVETLASGWKDLVAAQLPGTAVETLELPRFNVSGADRASNKRAMADYFDATSKLMVLETFREDFEIFGYSDDLHRQEPSRVPLAEMNRRLRDVHSKLGSDWLGKQGRRAVRLGRVLITPPWSARGDAPGPAAPSPGH